MDLLSRREHSRQELEDKLQKLSKDKQLIQATLTYLEENNLLNQNRYIEGLISSRVKRGQGPLKIKAEIIQKTSMSESEITYFMDSLDIKWSEHAKNAREKKFDTSLPSDRKMQERQIRFLLYRGFPMDIIMSLLKN